MFETTNQIKLIKMGHTVDGRNPAPVGKCVLSHYNPIIFPLFTVFQCVS